MTLLAVSLQAMATAWYGEECKGDNPPYCIKSEHCSGRVGGLGYCSILDYESNWTPEIVESSVSIDVSNSAPIETQKTVDFTVRFNFWWYDYKVRKLTYYARYRHKQFTYYVEIYADGQFLGNLTIDGKRDGVYNVSLKEERDYSNYSLVTMRDEGSVAVSAPLSIESLNKDKDYTITAKVYVRVSDVLEERTNYSESLGIVGSLQQKVVTKSSGGLPVKLRRESIKPEVKYIYQSVDETHTVKGVNNEYWLYNHPDAEFTLKLSDTNIEEGTGANKNFVGFFVGYGDNVSPFANMSSKFNITEAQSQCVTGHLIYSNSCTSSYSLSAKNREYIELAGDAGVTQCEGASKCDYSIAWGGEALWQYFQGSNDLRKIIEDRGYTCYIKSMCRPRNVLIKSENLSSYSSGSFAKTNIIDVSTWQGAESDVYYKNTYHLRDLELNTPLNGSPDYYGRKIKPGDVFNIKAKLFVPQRPLGGDLSFHDATRQLYSFAGFSVPVTTGAETGRKYTYECALSTYHNDGVQTKDMIKLRVVPAAVFPSLSSTEKAVRVVCGTNVPDSMLIEDDVIHITARELVLNGSGYSLSQYKPVYYWEYNTGNPSDKDQWKRIDGDPSAQRYLLQPQNFDFLESYNERDLFINSTVLLENGKFKPNKKVYFRQCATLTTFSSEVQSSLYADKMGDKNYCVRVVSSGYYTYMSRPSLNKENIVTKGAEDQILCWGDNIDTKNDSVKFCIAMGGDIQNEDLLKESREIAQYWAVRHAGGDSTEMKNLKISGDTCRFRMQYYPDKKYVPTDGDTIRYVMYIATCRDTVKKEFSIITYPKDRINVDDLSIIKDGYVSSRDNIKDTILINAVRGSAPALVVENANKEFYNYQWHTKTRITDYEYHNPVVIDFTRYQGPDFLDFFNNAMVRYGSPNVQTEQFKFYWYTEFYRKYSMEEYGYSSPTNINDEKVPDYIRRQYAQLCLDSINNIRQRYANEEFDKDNSWKEFDSQVTEPLVILQPHGKYLTMDENYFFIRRVGRGGSPTGQSCNSDSVRVTIKYFDPISKDSIEFADKSDSINVRVGDKIPRIVGSLPDGGYGNPATGNKDVTYMFFWQWSLDGYNDWQIIHNINGDSDYYQQRRGDKPTQQQNGISLREGLLTAEHPIVYIRRVVWSMIGTNEESKVEHCSNSIVVTTAKMLDPDKVFHYGHPDYDPRFQRYSVCNGEKDEICVAEHEEYLSADVQYVWDVRHYDDKSPVNFETDRYDMYPWWGYTDMHTLCRIVNDGRDYYYDVYRYNIKDGSRSNVVSDTVHVNVNKPLFKFRSSMDGFLSLHDVNDEDYVLTNGTRVELYDNSTIEHKRDFNPKNPGFSNYWNLQVQDFIEGAQPLASYTSYKEEPQLVLYNTGENKIQLTMISIAYTKDCYSRFTGSIYVAAPENGRTRGASAFIDEEDEFVRMDEAQYVDVYPTVLTENDIIHISTNYIGYSVRLFDSVGRILYNIEDLTGDYNLPVSLTKGTYMVYIDGKRFKILVK